MTPEGKLKAGIFEYLSIRSEWVLRMNSGKVKVRGGYMNLCPEGTADALIMRPIPHWLEIKAPGARTEKDRAAKQAEFRSMVLALGHKHCTAESLDDVIQFLGVRP